MNDARWDDVLWLVDSAIRHFSEAVLISDEGDVGTDSRASYRNEMALMHAMQAGYTSFENALLRTFEMLGEDKPTGESWHKQLVERGMRELPGSRPPIFPADLRSALKHARGFRHWAAHGYDDPFSPDDAASAIAAARRLAGELRPIFESFARKIDP